MLFNDLLEKEGLLAEEVQLMRHRPTERRMLQALPGLRLTRPDLFNAYQEWQRVGLFNSTGITTVASFFADGGGRATFAGLWRMNGKNLADESEWKADPRNAELIALGMDDLTKRPRATRERYQLSETGTLSDLIGRLLVAWKTRGQAWSHRADRQELQILAIHEENAFDPAPGSWDSVDIGWAELATLPPRRRAQLQEWRGVYMIFDEADGQRYVGSASGNENIYGRWQGYADRSDGGNVLLRSRDPAAFRFSILQRVSPDMPRDEVETIEANWKRRLHTRKPFGLNAN